MAFSSLPLEELQDEARKSNYSLNSREFAIYMDQNDPLRDFRNQFHIPTFPKPQGEENENVIYLCGNSLGVQPKQTQQLIAEELKVWADRGVVGHFNHPYQRPWVSIDEQVLEPLSKLVGGHVSLNEVALMQSLTTSLHLMMVSFYRPSATRFKILIEEKAFPSDIYAVTSQLNFHGYDASSLLTISPRKGEYTLRIEDILQMIENQGQEISLVLLSGVQYYTGQFFDIEQITRAAQQKGCMVGWDLAHAVGNVPLKLHDWNVDFAAWCSYKYLNAGPGSCAGIFVHERHRNRLETPRFAGWWGHDKSIRFKMEPQFVPMPGALGYQLSNPSVLTAVSLLASLNVFSQTSMENLRQKSVKLTGYLEFLLDTEIASQFPIQIITPKDPSKRGAQLSVLFPNMTSMSPLMRCLENLGIIVDEREPNVIRISPTPLYNTFIEVRKFIEGLKNALEQLRNA